MHVQHKNKDLLTDYFIQIDFNDFVQIMLYLIGMLHYDYKR